MITRLLLTIVLFFLSLNSFASKINVKACGAKGDGVTDDTEKLIFAISSADTIIIPKGIYLISKQLKFVDVSNKTIMASSAIIKNNNNSAGTLEFARGNNISIIGGTWTRTALPKKEGTGNEHTFTFVAIKNLNVKNVTINGSPEMGIAMIGVVNGNIADNDIQNCFRDGIYSHYSVKLTYNGNRLENIKDDAMSIHDYGIAAQKPEVIAAGYSEAGQSTVINNTAKNVYQGFASIGCDQLYISGNKITGTVNAGIAISNSENLFRGGTARAKNIMITDNIITNAGGTQNIMGVNYTNSGQLSTGRSALFIAVLDSSNLINKPKSRLTNISVVNNEIKDSYVNGAYIAQTDGLVFKNNSFVDCNISNSPYCGNIVEIINCNKTVINNNKIIDDRKTPLHKVGYQINNVEGQMSDWKVKGYQSKANNLIGLQPIITK